MQALLNRHGAVLTSVGHIVERSQKHFEELPNPVDLRSTQETVPEALDVCNLLYLGSYGS